MGLSMNDSSSAKATIESNRSRYFAAGEAADDTIDEHIFPPRKLRMKARTQIQ